METCSLLANVRQHEYTCGPGPLFTHRELKGVGLPGQSSPNPPSGHMVSLDYSLYCQVLVLTSVHFLRSHSLEEPYRWISHATLVRIRTGASPQSHAHAFHNTLLMLQRPPRLLQVQCCPVLTQPLRGGAPSNPILDFLHWQSEFTSDLPSLPTAVGRSLLVRIVLPPVDHYRRELTEGHRALPVKSVKIYIKTTFISKAKTRVISVAQPSNKLFF